MDAILHFLHSLIFASDAVLMALSGGAFWAFAVLCLMMDRRREKKRDVMRLEKVGFMPWTGMFMGSAIIGGGLLAMSLPVVIGNL
jgi:hypothetical protein